VHFAAVFNRQKTRTVTIEALGHAFYGSIAKRSFQKQCKNYPNIHGQTKEGGRSIAPLSTPLKVLHPLPKLTSV